MTAPRMRTHTGKGNVPRLTTRTDAATAITPLRIVNPCRMVIPRKAISAQFRGPGTRS